ncbi:TlyA family RNA methyltransferase [Sporosarcina limicola]|uniref:23S rRNA (Cytidine1920-2'-O)/16S rRNA (Cytidine1409-2'-O)-methyltransferase n=1 Tax=Sporosarcina limicola TaxID=34101 RepID=A0A927MFP9_9BACL|nr:TlyA family RNA methyltransferase [Sporosarcina limicola]MBE1553793.1 23S rRNA (cytidine1920-2'-O)/16S rRNA (cytidine1409-2'-O)-methyltransferase [Sporosarcina limicola]
MTNKVPKERVDVLLVERGLIETREQAKRSIMAGIVYSAESRLDKPGEKIPSDAPLTVKGPTLKYVSRGGLKLEKALGLFDVDVKDKIILDIGSSTGGFTDCALQNGASHCYALDVGYNQLAWKIRQDPRVTVMERTNFRHATSELFIKGVPQFATIDVSFISLTLILPALKHIIVEGGNVIALVKPQFEAGKGKVGKKGVVKEKSIHLDVLKKIADASAREGFSLQGISYSPVTGGEGNIEFLFHLISEADPKSLFDANAFDKLVEDAYQELL